MIYVMSDLHGEYDKFIEMLDLINFSSEDKLYILGDVFDRGEKPLDIIDYIRKPENSNIELLLGNHESFYLSVVEDETNLSLWLYNGGYTTFKQLEQKDESYIVELINYLKSLPLYKVIDNFILVHAGLRVPINCENLNIDIDTILNSQDEDSLLWERDFIQSDRYINDFTVICGHTPTINKEDSSKKAEIKHLKGKVMIDCGAYFKNYNGRLGCLRLDDFKEFYIG